MHSLDPRLQDLLERFESRQRVALARAITLVENERPGFQAFLHHVLQNGLRSRRVGLTGPPGAGKSSLVAALAAAWRADDEEVGVVAVDPTSPYSGGALLGDRIRMNDLATDPGIFIRSMATRGSLGGLAATTREVLDLMDGFGFPRLLVETVGVGQTELEITGAADTVVVVLVPESGDGIQAMKAGLMEIADIFVINKADRPGADRLLKEVRAALHLRGKDVPQAAPSGGHHGVDLSAVGPRAAAVNEHAEGPRRTTKRWEAPEGWQIPVLKTVAHAGEGVDELRGALQAHRDYLTESGELDARRRARTATRIRDVVDRELRRRTWADEGSQRRLAEGPGRVIDGDDTPYSVAAEIVQGLLRSEHGGRE
jgi:LAO/AO transport system kinase